MRLAPFLFVLFLLAPAVLTPAAAAAKPTQKPCAARNSVTVAKSIQVRIYERGGDDHLLIGCNRQTGGRTGLASWFNCDCSRVDEEAPQVWLAGRHVAVNQYSCSPFDAMAPCVGGVEVYDLRSGRVRYSDDTATLIALVIKPNGSVAYVLGQQLIRIDTRGRAIVDDGPGIDSGSLAINRTRLYWLRDNLPQSTSLR